MPNGWIIALKKWNTGKQTWCLPKKGTDAYNEVMALMPEKKLKESAEPEKAAPPMKIPMEQQRKPMSDKDAPKIKFVEPAKKAEEVPMKKKPKEKKPKRPSLASLLKEYKGPYQSYDDSEGNEVMYPTRVIKELITLAYNGASLNEIAAAIGYDKDEVKIMLYDNYESRI